MPPGRQTAVPAPRPPRNVVIALRVPLQTEGGRDLGTAEVELPVLIPWGHEGEVGTVTVNLTVGKVAYPIELQLPVDEDYKDRLNYKARPLIIEPHEIEELEIMRGTDGKPAGMLKKTYPVAVTRSTSRRRTAD